MKPSCRVVLNLLRDRESVTTHDFLMEGAGSRFGARIRELRELGFVIDEKRLPLPARGSRYRLVGEPEQNFGVAAGCDEAADGRPCQHASRQRPPEADIGSLFDDKFYERTFA